MEEFVVYILFSEKHQKIYIGYTSDLIQRLHSHNTFATKGHTIRYRPWKVIHVEFFDSAVTAMKRVKSGQGRQWIWEHVLPQMIKAGFISA